MSLIDKIANVIEDEGIFGVVAAPRLGGKTTIAGTLKGKTALVQASLLETGAKSALRLAKKLDNQLDVFYFASLHELQQLLVELYESDYDNVFIDGISATTEMRYEEEDVVKKRKSDQWGSFRMIKETMVKVMLAAKTMSTEQGKNVFMTLALDPKYNGDGALVELRPNTKGNATMSEINKLCPVVLTLREEFNEEEQSNERQLVTKSVDCYPGRIDSLLDEDNPGVLPADLSLVVDLIKGDK